MPRKDRPRVARRAPRDMSAAVHRWSFDVGRPDHGARLDAFLRPRISWRARAAMQRAITDGAVQVLPAASAAGASIGRLRPGMRLRRGQVVVVELPAPQAEPGAGERSWQIDAIPLIYEDDDLLAVSKPPSLNVYPSRRHRAGSLIELMHERDQSLSAGGERPSPCHRLDRETTGLMLFARNASSRTRVQLQFEERRVRKSYLALVEGEVEHDRGEIDLPLGPALGALVEMRVAPQAHGAGLTALTTYRVRRRLEGRTLLELEPATGRRHQLRVHLAAIGHPIVGDKLYLGGDALFLRSLDGALQAEDLGRLGASRQVLHAWKLAFDHPASGERMLLEAPIWPDMQRLLEEPSAPAPAG